MYIKRVKGRHHPIHFTQSPLMRKIEQQMIDAINANKNWCSGNTMVKTDDANISRVFLHGNHIATITDDDMMIMDGGWQSVTTKSRLNALCQEFRPQAGVFQKDWTWFIRHGNSVFPFITGSLI